MQIGNQVSKSLVDISAVKTDTDWFDEALTSHKSAAGLIIGDNGMELLILTEHEKVKDGDLKVRFYDHTEAAGTLKKYDSNTGLAVVSVNLSDVEQQHQRGDLLCRTGLIQIPAQRTAGDRCGQSHWKQWLFAVWKPDICNADRRTL